MTEGQFNIVVTFERGSVCHGVKITHYIGHKCSANDNNFGTQPPFVMQRADGFALLMLRPDY